MYCLRVPNKLNFLFYYFLVLLLSHRFYDGYLFINKRGSRVDASFFSRSFPPPGVLLWYKSNDMNIAYRLTMYILKNEIIYLSEEAMFISVPTHLFPHLDLVRLWNSLNLRSRFSRIRIRVGTIICLAGVGYLRVAPQKILLLWEDSDFFRSEN